MNKKSKPLRAFVTSCETQKPDAKPALTPKLRFPELWETGLLHAKPRSREKEGGGE